MRRPPVSEGARQLCAGAEVIDLHIDTFIPMRLWGFDPKRCHPSFPGWFFGHLDAPRMVRHGLKGAMWSITTQPFRSRAGRWRTFLKNVDRLTRQVEAAGPFRVVADGASYRAARSARQMPVLISVQGAHAVDGARDDLSDVPHSVWRLTLVHLTPTAWGAPSSPLHRVRRHKGLTAFGRARVEAMNARRIFVDLAHLHPRGFWDGLDAHRADLPPLVTHAGVAGVHRHWRNVEDDQIRAIADRGGVIGVITAGLYLGRTFGGDGAALWARHVEHLIRVGGEDVAAIGTDFDGFIVPAAGIRGAHAYPHFVQALLDRGFSEERIRKVLGGNALRVIDQLRPAAADAGANREPSIGGNGRVDPEAPRFPSGA